MRLRLVYWFSDRSDDPTDLLESVDPSEKFVKMGCGRQPTQAFLCLSWLKTLFGRPLNYLTHGYITYPGGSRDTPKAGKSIM